MRSSQLTSEKEIRRQGKHVEEYLLQVSNAIKKMTREDYPPYVLGVLQSLEIVLDKLRTDWPDLLLALIELIVELKKAEKEEEKDKIYAKQKELLDEYKETIDELRLIIAELVQVGGQPGG